MIFKSFKEWAEALAHSVVMVLSGLYCVLFLCLIMGTVSVIYCVIRKINAFFRREFAAGCIVTAIIACLLFGWVTTFVKERYQRVQAQHVADSLAYDLSKFTQMYDTAESIVVNRDTIVYTRK